MKFKQILKKKLGSRYQSLYLKNILKKLLGNFFFNIRDRIRNMQYKFNFLRRVDEYYKTRDAKTKQDS